MHAMILLLILACYYCFHYLFPAKKLDIQFDKNLQQQLDAYQQDHHPANNKLLILQQADTAINDTSTTAIIFL